MQVWAILALWQMRLEEDPVDSLRPDTPRSHYHPERGKIAG